jgi:hypothetical protein
MTIQCKLSKLNLLGANFWVRFIQVKSTERTDFCVRNKQVFALYRLNQQRGQTVVFVINRCLVYTG